jgi:hypothetical protein
MPLSARLFALVLPAAVAALPAAEPAGTEGLQTPPDLALDLIAREPVVAQPVFLNFDERGRMWVVQYLQYPEPAGLKVLSRDSVWRVRYDRPKPPPPYDTPDKYYSVMSSRRICAQILFGSRDSTRASAPATAASHAAPVPT